MSLIIHFTPFTIEVRKLPLHHWFCMTNMYKKRRLQIYSKFGMQIFSAKISPVLSVFHFQVMHFVVGLNADPTIPHSTSAGPYFHNHWKFFASFFNCICMGEYQIFRFLIMTRWDQYRSNNTRHSTSVAIIGPLPHVGNYFATW